MTYSINWPITVHSTIPFQKLYLPHYNTFFQQWHFKTRLPPHPQLAKLTISCLLSHSMCAINYGTIGFQLQITQKIPSKKVTTKPAPAVPVDDKYVSYACIQYTYFRQHFLNKITDAQRQSELFVHELLDLHEHSSILTNGMTLQSSEIDSLIASVCCT